MIQRDVIVGIVGGRGKMGAWFRSFLEGQGCKVLISGRDTALNPREMARRCDVVIISVPIRATVDIIRQVGPHVRQDALFTDLTSLKIQPVKAMLTQSRAEVIGMHPLFGPGAQSLEGQNVILCPARGDNWLPWLQGMLVRNGARAFISTPEKHDRMMSVIQGLRYFCSLSLGGAMMTMGARMPECEKFSTPIYRIFMDVVGRLLYQDPTLTAEICLHNPETMAAVRVFRDWVDRWVRLFEQSDTDKFAAHLNEIRNYFGEFCKEASGETEFIIQALLQQQSQNSVDLELKN
ncbi:MAG: prephenate dehydrogenase/arogenate dehydrogenase family protein [Deltaproteobacteria bacterium]|nr:prephenate dehydrogenase/arogenate dehydrogenase family protein [Deltaproteobacteria bacterium]MBW2305583.1 prephenate dehydrogenase/arogenate dehydrogenase family protein [Deltaproteobacteria bacterium]